MSQSRHITPSDSGAADANRVVWMPSQFRREPKTWREKRLRERAQTVVREYSEGEDLTNALTHGIGTALSIAALVIMLVTAGHHGGGVRTIAALLFGVPMIAQFCLSTLHHAIQADAPRRVLRVLDRCAAYVFIAGAYSPFCLLVLPATIGRPLLIGVWVVAAAGVAFETFWTYRPRWLTALVYLVMGWIMALFIPQLLEALALPGFVLLLVAGACYSVGAVFYCIKQVPYFHLVFHVLTLAASICLFLLVALYVL